MPRRQHITLIGIIVSTALVGLTFVSLFAGQPDGTRAITSANAHAGEEDALLQVQEPVLLEDEVLRGAASAPKLENATLK